MRSPIIILRSVLINSSESGKEKAMKQRLKSLMVATFLLVVVLFTTSVTWSFERQIPNRIPEDQIIPQPFEGFEKSGAYCEIINDFNSPAYYYASFDSGMGFAVYMDPAQCGESPYPFEITDVHFYLYDPDETYNWPVAIRVNIRDSDQGDSCSGPQDVLCSEDFSIPSDSAYPYMMTLNFSTLCCVNQPFFLEIVYMQPRDPAHPHPSPLMDDDTFSADTCDNWVIWSDLQYYEWYDYWSPPPPGDAIIRATGYAGAIECDSLWYWKADKPDQEFPALSGMPDFDQYQFGEDSVVLCGPTAVANCLWWFNAVPAGMTPPDLIRLLCTYFKCDPYNVGTYVDSLQLGLDQYFIDFGFDLSEHTYCQPDFFEIEDSLKRCQDIILLLGFWWYDEIEQTWWRTGGHYVTMAGVCSGSLKIAISDPALDRAVGGWPGRVRPPTHLPAGTYPPEYHNDPQYVSQDVYQSILDNPFPCPGNPFWEIDYIWWDKGEYSGINVPDKFRSVTRPAPKDGKIIFATEVEYAVMICSKPLRGDANGDGVIDLGDVLYLISYLYKGGPAPDPLWTGDANCDGIVDLGDVLYLINYLYKGGPPPGC